MSDANMDQSLAKTATVEAMSSREMQEVKGMVFMAKQFPRDVEKAQDAILKACERKALAERAMYEFPRGGQKVDGPSIRLAEAIAQAWGNIDFGITELEQKDGESVVMARAWDLETNTRQSKVFTVKHDRATKSGTYRLTDPRDIYEMVANQGARRLRSCILGIIPGDVIDAAVDKCKETLAGAIGKREEVMDRLTKAFKEYGVTVPMMEKLFGCGADAFTSNNFIRLGNILTSIKDGMGKPQEYFPELPAEKPTGGKTGQTGLDKELGAGGAKQQ